MSTAAESRVPAVTGWFDENLPGGPALLGSRCSHCGTLAFPPASSFCSNPDCVGGRFEVVPLSRTGTVWSSTDARYQPPPPYVCPTEEHQPFAIVAVELEAERLVVLGQVVAGLGVDDVPVGSSVELVVDELFTQEDGTVVTVWKWRPLGAPTVPGG